MVAILLKQSPYIISGNSGDRVGNGVKNASISTKVKKLTVDILIVDISLVGFLSYLEKS